MSRTNTPSPAPPSIPRSSSPALAPPSAKPFRQSLGPSTIPTPSTAPTTHRQTMGPTSSSNPRHAASGDRLAMARASSPRLPGTGSGFESLGNVGGRMGGPGSGRPSSEYIGSSAGGVFKREEVGTPEPDLMNDWFTDLTQYETTLEAMATASLDQNFTDELSAIEQWFRVLNEHERTAALYSLLQHSTQVQIRFFMTVLQQMARSDPMTALLSPAFGTSMQAQMESRLAARSPMVGGGFPNSPSVNQFLAPESALDGLPGSASATSNSAQLSAQRNKMRQNRISAPGTLQPSSAGYTGGGLGDVIERGTSPGAESTGSNAHLSAGENGGSTRPKSTDFAGIANVPNDASGVFGKSPRPGTGSAGLQGSPALGNMSSPKFDDQMSPMLGNWASMVNTPLIPMFGDNSAAVQAQQAENLSNALRAAGAGGPAGRVVLEDASKFRRTSARHQQAAQSNTGMYGDDGELLQQASYQPGRAASPLGNGQFGGAAQWTRSPVPGDGFNSATGAYGMAGLSGLGMGGIGLGYDGQAGLNGLGMGLGGMGQLLTPGQLMSLNHAQQSATAATFAAASAMGQFGQGAGSGFSANSSSSWRGDRVSSRPERGKRSPLLRGSPSPSASGTMGQTAGGGGGAGAGAGVAGEDDVDERTLKDVPHWLRVLRLHKYTTNFAGYKWQDMVVMNDEQLTEKGVAALGARRKLLKAFANIRNHYKIPHPEGYDPEELAQPANASAPKDE